MLAISHLGANNEVVPLPACLLQDFAHDNLGLSTRVPLCGVEEVDPEIIRLPHACFGALCIVNLVLDSTNYHFVNSTFRDITTEPNQLGQSSSKRLRGK